MWGFMFWIYMLEVIGARRRRLWCGYGTAGAGSRQSNGEGRRPEGDIYRDAETPRAGLTLSHMLIGYLRRIFLDVTVHTTPMPSGRARNFRPINIDTYITGLDMRWLTQGHPERTRCCCNAWKWSDKDFVIFVIFIRLCFELAIMQYILLVIW